MQSHWAEDTPANEPQPRNASCCCHCNCHSRDADTVFPPPWPKNPEGPVPFLMLRGRWLTQMGFHFGTQVNVEREGDRVVLSFAGPPQPAVPGVPTRLEREVRYTEVEPYTHLRPTQAGAR